MTKRSALITLGVSTIVLVTQVTILALQVQRGPLPVTACDPGLILTAAVADNLAPNSRCSRIGAGLMELRTYAVDPNRNVPGSPAAIVFKEIEILTKSGATVLGRWQQIGQPAALIYMVEFRDGAHREAVWAAFKADPEWIALRTNYAVPQPTTVVFLGANDYPPIPANPGTGIGRGVGGQQQGAYAIGGGVSAPQALVMPQPEYSEDGRKAGIEGTVELAIIVRADGTVQFVSVKKSLGYGLDAKAIEAVRKSKFRPGQKDGNSVPVMTTVQMNFSLR